MAICSFWVFEYTERPPHTKLTKVAVISIINQQFLVFASFWVEKSTDPSQTKGAPHTKLTDGSGPVVADVLHLADVDGSFDDLGGGVEVRGCERLLLLHNLFHCLGEELTRYIRKVDCDGLKLLVSPPSLATF